MTTMYRRLVAAHQPNFFPWLGFFDKLRRADVFVVMDAVQFPKSGAGGWSNRVKILVNGEPAWATMPVVRAHHGTRLIRDVEISESVPWRERLLGVLRHSYGKAPHFAEAFDLLRPLVELRTESLYAYNSNAIGQLAGAMGLPTSRLAPMSELTWSGRATDLLISLVRAVDGDAYLCGGGSAGYLEEDKFVEAGVALVYQDFQHPVYPHVRTTEFVPGLSIIDPLMNCGLAGTRDLLHHGRSGE